jgi:Family of unknown function (DUF5996)
MRIAFGVTVIGIITDGKRDRHLARAALRQLARDRRDAAALRQIVGRVRLTLTPWLKHGRQVPLYVTARGFGTSPIPVGCEILEIEFDFDFISHRLVARTSRGRGTPAVVGATNDCRFLSSGDRSPKRHRDRCRHPRDAERSAEPDTLFPGQ